MVDRGRVVQPTVGGERLEGNRVVESGAKRSGDGGQVGRVKGTTVQPLEGKIERCASDALRAKDMGVSASFSVIQTRENVLTASPRRKGRWLTPHSDGYQ